MIRVAVTTRSLTLLRRLRTEVGRFADDAVTAIVGAWADGWDRLSPAWQAAAGAAVDAATRSGGWPSSWQLARIPEVGAASWQTEQTTGLLVAASTRLAQNAAAGAVNATIGAEPEILASQSSGSVASDFSRGIDRARVDALHQDARARVHDSSATLASDTIRSAHQTMIRAGGQVDAGVMLGRIHAAFAGGRASALNVARTETLDAYRAASGYVHDVNAEAIPGWVWTSALDLRECAACWAMHGTIHPLREPGPQGHVACRCARMPLVRTAPGLRTTDLTGVLPDALDHFRALPRADQLRVMGPARLQLLDDGDIAWADLATRRTNKGWRSSYSPRSVSDLRRLAGHR